MIVGGQTEARGQLSSTIIDYHEPFDQSLSDLVYPGAPLLGLARSLCDLRRKCIIEHDTSLGVISNKFKFGG